MSLEAAKELYESRVRLSYLDDPTEADPAILAFANHYVGQVRRLRTIAEAIAVVFPHKPVFASTACNCGLPNCVGRPYGVIGYVDGAVDDRGIAQGRAHHLLRFDFVPEDQS